MNFTPLNRSYLRLPSTPEPVFRPVDANTPPSKRSTNVPTLPSFLVPIEHVRHKQASFGGCAERLDISVMEMTTSIRTVLDPYAFYLRYREENFHWPFYFHFNDPKVGYRQQATRTEYSRQHIEVMFAPAERMEDKISVASFGEYDESLRFLDLAPSGMEKTQILVATVGVPRPSPHSWDS
ncbi:hypothetical protein BT69DRAFT_192980 [Atractiella rhizophila]|nr:hypothetical protein BT69DRAFT_192980 [Atractiella rhizophila]